VVFERYASMDNEDYENEKKFHQEMLGIEDEGASNQ
jgi:hypothetical protein